MKKNIFPNGLAYFWRAKLNVVNSVLHSNILWALYFSIQVVSCTCDGQKMYLQDSVVYNRTNSEQPKRVSVEGLGLVKKVHLWLSFQLTTYPVPNNRHVTLSNGVFLHLKSFIKREIFYSKVILRYRGIVELQSL